jgi:hypothetical protein
MSGFTTIVFCNVASISKVELAGNRAKGLHLRNLRRTWTRSTRTLLFAKKEERIKIEASNRESKRNLEPKTEKSCSGWASWNKRQASPLTKILSRWIRSGVTSCAGPARRTCAGWKFTKLVQAKVTIPWIYKCTRVASKGRMFRKFLFCNINLRRVFFMPGSLVTITAIIAAVAWALFSRVARVFVVSRGFRGCSAFSAIFFLDQLRGVVKQM